MPNRKKTIPWFKVIAWLFLIPSWFSCQDNCQGCDSEDISRSGTSTQIAPTNPSRQQDLPEGKKPPTYENLNKCFAHYQDQYVRVQKKVAEAEAGTFPCLETSESQAVAKDLILKINEDFISFEQAQKDSANDPEIIKNLSEKLSSLALNYQKLLLMFATCRTNNFVTKTPINQQILEEDPIKSGSLLLHVVGDVFGGNNKELEGNQSRNTLALRIDYLKKLKDTLLKDTFIDDKNLLSPCSLLPDMPFTREPGISPDLSIADLANLINIHELSLKLLNKFESSDLDDFRAELIRQLKALKKTGDSVFLPGGWEKHAIVYQFIKQSDGKYTFRVFNSGEGINAYHAFSVTGYQVQFMPFAEVTDLSLEAITLQSFLKALMVMKSSEGSLATKPEHLYEMVLPLLDGKPSKVTFDASKFLSAQQAGTCSYYSQSWLMASTFDQMRQDGSSALEGFLPSELEALFALKTLYDFSEHLKSRGDVGLYENRALLNKSITYLSNDLASQKTSDAGLLEAAANIEESLKKAIENQINTKNELLQSKKIEVPAVISAQTPEVLDKNLPDIVSIAPVIGGDTAKPESMMSEAPNVVNSKTSLAKAVLAINAVKFKDSPIQRINYIRDIASKLSLEKADWQLSHKDAISIIEMLSQIELAYVSSILAAIADHTRVAKTIYTVDFLVAVKLLAVSDMLNQSFIDAHDRIPSLYQAVFTELLYRDNAIIEAYHPLWHQELLELREYFKYSITSNSFFGLEYIHAGSSNDFRRVMFDPRTKFISNKHWSDQISWPDVSWVDKWINSHPDYKTWIVGARSRAKSWLEPFVYTFKYGQKFVRYYEADPKSPPDGTREKRIYVKNKPDESRIKDDTISRREALLLMGKQPSRFSSTFPKSYFYLKDLSLAVDYLLSGNFSQGTKPDIYFSQVEQDARFNHALIVSDQEITVNKWELIPDSDPPSYRTIADPLNFPIVENTKFDGSLLKNVVNNAAEDLAGYSEENRELCRPDFEPEKRSRFVCLNTHLQNGVRPFRKFEKLFIKANDKDKNKKQNAKISLTFNIQALMNIYSTGVDQAKSAREIEEDKLLGAFQNETEASYNPLLLAERIRLLPNDLIVKNPYAGAQSLRELTLERIRGVFSLSGIKELQLVETLAIFSQYSSLFAREEYQRLFEKLMFEPGLLLNQLKINPEESAQFIKKLVDFSRLNFNRFKQYDNLKEMAFVLRMNQIFKSFIMFASLSPSYKVPAGSAKGFLDSPKELFNYVNNNNNLDDSERGFLFLNILDMYNYSNDLSENDIFYLLLSKIKYNAFSVVSPLLIDKYMINANKNILQDKIHAIQKTLNDVAKRNAILDKIVDNMDLSFKSNTRQGAWSPVAVAANNEASRVFRASFSTGKIINIDVIQGNFYQEGIQKVALPNIPEEYFKTIFPNGIPSGVMANVLNFAQKKYSLVVDGREIKFQLEPFILQEKINGHWYQLLDKSYIESFRSLAFKKDRQNWLREDKKQALIRDNSGEILYVLTLNNIDDKICIEKVENIIDKLTRVYVSAWVYPMNVFSHIESINFIEIWRNKNGRLEVHLPRFSIKFVADENNHFDCASHKGYKLSLIDYSIPLGNPVNYLMCDKQGSGQNSRIILMPAFRPYINEESSLSSDFKMDKKISVPRPGSQILLTYKENNNELEPPSQNVEIYNLALRKWWQHDYSEARRLLGTGDASIAPLSKSKGEVDALIWLMMGRTTQFPTKDAKNENSKENKVQDLDPEANAVRMLAASILLSQDDEFKVLNQFFNTPGTPEEAQKLRLEAGKLEKTPIFDKVFEIALIYRNYLTNLHTIGEKWVGFYDEWIVASFIDNILNSRLFGWVKHVHTDVINNRMMVLKNIHPSRFLDQQTTTAFRPKILQGQGVSGQLKMSKAMNEILSFQLFKHLFKAKSADSTFYFRATILNPSEIFADEGNFPLFYAIARGEKLSKNDKDKAVDILVKLMDLKNKSLTDEDIIKEYMFLFSLSSLYHKGDKNYPKDPNVGNKNARFFELVSMNKDHMPGSKDVQKDLDDHKTLRDEIRSIDDRLEILDKNYKTAYDKNILLKKIDELRSKITDLQNKAKAIETKYDTIFTNHLTKTSAVEPCFKTTITADKDVPVQESSKASVRDESIKDFRVGDAKVVDPFSAPYLSGDKFAEIFNSKNLSDQQKNQLENDKNSLILKLDRVGFYGTPNNVKAGIEKLIAGIKKYSEKLQNETVIYFFKSGKSSADLRQMITSQMDLVQEEMSNARTEAMALVNQRTMLDKNAALIRIKRLAKIEDEPKLNDLLYLFLTNQLAASKEAAAEKDRFDKIDLNLLKFLLTSTFYQYLNSCLDLIKTYEKMDNSQEKRLILNQLANQLKEKRHYDYKEHVEYLIFEYFMGIHIRKMQVDALNKLKIKNGQIGDPDALGVVIGLIMGAGKTTVLLPLLSVLNTKEDWLNVIMIPESLITSMARDLKKNIGRSFNRAIYIFDINRQSKPSGERLAQIYDQFVRAQKEKGTIVTTNSAMQSLFLTYIEFLYRYDIDKNQVDKKITEIVKIFQLLRKYGRLTIDEVDMALDVLKSHQFSAGNRIAIHKTITSTVFAFYRMLATSNIKNSAKLSFIKESSGEPLTTSSYNQKLRKNIIDKLITDMDYFNNDGPLKSIYNKFIAENENAQLLKNYLDNSDTNARSILFAKIDKIYDNEAEKIEMKNIATVLYEQINQMFLLTASKSLNIHYGRLPLPVKEEDENDEDFNARFKLYQDSKYISIPYHAGTPAPNSRFGSAIEALNYTIQRWLQDRDFEDQINTEIKALKVKNLLSSSADTQKEIDQRMKAIFGSSPPKVTRITNAEIDKAISDLKAGGNTQRIEAALLLIKNYALPQLKTYENHLTTNAQIYGSIFRWVSGFSGTLWSIDTFPNIFLKDSDNESETTAKTFMLLWRQYQRNKEKNNKFTAVTELDSDKLMLAEPNRIKALVNGIYDDKKPVSLADLGGILRGGGNLEVAKAIHDQRVSMEGVVYYDEEGKIEVLGPTKDISTPLDNNSIEKDKLLAYWDKKHTTGSDIKLKADMVARVTFDHHTFSRDLEQTVWRLRGLDLGQSVDRYFALKEDLLIILTKMREILDLRINAKDFDLGDLLLFVRVNQEVRLGELLHRALKYKMSNVISKEALDRMFEENISNEQAHAIYKSFASMFLKNISAEPYIYLGFPIYEESKAVAIESDKSMALQQNIKNALDGLGPQVLPSVTASIDKLIEDIKGLLPDKLKVSKSETESEVEMEQEQEVETETTKQVDSYEFNNKFLAHKIIKWNFLDNDWTNFTPIAFQSFGEKEIFDEFSVETPIRAPLFRLSDALNEKYEKLSKAIDEKILVTLNWAPLQYRRKFSFYDRYQFEFFNIYQKVITNILVVVSNGANDQTNSVQTIIIDGNDAKQFDELLRNYDSPNKKIALFSLTQGIFRQSPNNRINELELLKNEQFIKQLVQVKFFAGYLEYSPAEQSELETWLKKYDRYYLVKLFRDKILHYKQDSPDQMIHSDIGHIFEKIGAF